MSGQVNTYVLWGLKLPYEKYLAVDINLDDPYVPDYPNPIVLNDGMGGEYVFIGHCIAKTDLDEQGTFFQPVEIPRDKDERLRWQDDVKKFMMTLGLEIPANQKFHWYVVSHVR